MAVQTKTVTTGTLITRAFLVEDLDKREPIERVEAANAMFCVDYLKEKYELEGINIVVPEDECNATTRFLIRQVEKDDDSKVLKTWAVIRRPW